MSKPEFKLFPCVFCTIGFNSYVAVNKLAVLASNKIKGERNRNISDEEVKIASDLKSQ